MAGVVVRADILEDKDGKSRGIGTVTFEQSIEAVQAICILLWTLNSWLIVATALLGINSPKCIII